MELHELEDHDRGGLVYLTTDEERGLAQVVMDAISPIWVDGEHLDVLHSIYISKCLGGHYLSIDGLADLIRVLDFYEFDLPPLELNNRKLVAPQSIRGETPKETKDLQHEWVRKYVRTIWRETWEQHEGIKKAADEYEVFPGEAENARAQREQNDSYNFQQVRIEKEFWDEVDRVHQEYGGRRSQAIILVKDYKKRGDLSRIDSDQRARLGDLIQDDAETE